MTPDEEALEIGMAKMGDLEATAFQALKALPQDRRGLVTCWFCPVCQAFVGPGEKFCCPWPEVKAKTLLDRAEAAWGSLPPETPFGVVLRLIREHLA